MPTFSKCGRSNSGFCDGILTGKSFKFKNGQVYHVKRNINCSKILLYMYVSAYQGCLEKYIGQAGNELKAHDCPQATD